VTARVRLVDKDDRSIGNREPIHRAGLADHVVDVVFEPSRGTLRRPAPCRTPGCASVIRLPPTVRLSFDEYAIAPFLAGSEQTWPVYLFAQLRVPSLLPQLIAVSSVVFIASMLLILSAEIGRRIAQRRYGREFSAQGLAWSR
jgi:hypothetical protein